MKKVPQVNPAPKDFEKHEIENMANTLLEAETIKAHPKKMAAVHAHLSKKKKAINSIQGLRDKRKELQKEALEEKAPAEKGNPDEAAEGEV